jgi:hypothetical protein
MQMLILLWGDGFLKQGIKVHCYWMPSPKNRIKLLLTSNKDTSSLTEQLSKNGFQLVPFIYVVSAYIPARGI